MGERMADLVSSFGVHLLLTYGGLLAGLCLSFVLVFGCMASRALAAMVIGLTGVLQVIPSLALVALIVSFLGIGLVPSLIVVAVSTLLPLVRNTYTGLTSPREPELEAARGIGLSTRETFWSLRVPVASPAFFSGLRFAAVIANSVAIVTVFIGSGGLGAIILEGLSRFYLFQIAEGTLPAIALALVNDFALSRIEYRLVPEVYRAT